MGCFNLIKNCFKNFFSCKKENKETTNQQLLNAVYYNEMYDNDIDNNEEYILLNAGKIFCADRANAARKAISLIKISEFNFKKTKIIININMLRYSKCTLGDSPSILFLEVFSAMLLANF